MADKPQPGLIWQIENSSLKILWSWECTTVHCNPEGCFFFFFQSTKAK